MTSPTPHQPQQTPAHSNADSQQSAQAPESAEVPQQAQAPQTPQEPAPYEETRIERAIGRGFGRVTSRALAPYQTAVIRIGFSATWLLFLLREWPHRAELYGPDSPWSLDMARRLLDGNHAFSVLPWSDSRGWFECVYLARHRGQRAADARLAHPHHVGAVHGRRALAAEPQHLHRGRRRQRHPPDVDVSRADPVRAGLVAGRTPCEAGSGRRSRVRCGRRAAAPRTASRDLPGIILWAVLGLGLAVAQLSGNYGLAWSEGGPVPHIGWSLVLWGLWLTHGVWWAVQRYAPGEPRIVLDTLAKLAHNGALLVIMVEVCLIYATAGWYKIQGSRWQDGTARLLPDAPGLLLPLARRCPSCWAATA